jgi:hypothetical protein
VVSNLTVRSVGNGVQSGTGEVAQSGTGSIPVTIVGFNVSGTEAKKLYDMVAAGAQPALYDHNPGTG